MAKSQVETRLDALEGLVTELTSSNEAKDAQIAEMQKELDGLKNPEAGLFKPKKKEKTVLPIPEEIFKVAGNEYRFKIAQFRYKKEGAMVKITAEEALKNSELCKELVELKRFAIIEAV